MLCCPCLKAREREPAPRRDDQAERGHGTGRAQRGGGREARAAPIVPGRRESCEGRRDAAQGERARGAGSPLTALEADMKAVRIHEFGGPEKVRLEDIPIPKVTRGKALVR